MKIISLADLIGSLGVSAVESGGDRPSQSLTGEVGGGRKERLTAADGRQADAFVRSGRC